ncbi:MAG: hypothetical protein PHC61_03560 [Chitinivibrionales bacterium]|nr:hypothetical protein [Chitinivibrionales bacterium]
MISKYRYFTRATGAVAGALRPAGLQTRLVVNDNPQTGGLEFGEYIVQLSEQCMALGIVAINFMEAALPFYHVISKGINLIADIALADLPILPVVQTDNALHARQAAAVMRSWNKSDVLVTGFWPVEANWRFAVFKEEFQRDNPEAKISYVKLDLEYSRGKLNNFFINYSKNKGVFSCEYSSSHFIASYFHQYGVTVEKNLIIYDCEDDLFEFRGLKPLRGIAPSFKALGERLGQKLIYKIQNGHWQEPLIEKI